jgi:hypothetical protein
MKWNGRYYRPANGVPVYPKKEQSITELLKPLGEKIDKGNVWRPILNQPINVFKEEATPIPSPTPTSTVTPTPSITPTSTVTPTPTTTPTPTPTPSSTPPTPFDPDAEAYLAAVISAGGSVDATISGATETLFLDLKLNTLYSKLIAFYPIVGGVQASHSINGNLNVSYDISYNGAWAHSVSGQTGPNGGYGLTNYIIPSGSTAGATQNLSIGLYANTNTDTYSGFEMDMGVRNTSGTGNGDWRLIVGWGGTNDSRVYMGSTTNEATISPRKGVGFYVGTRTSNTAKLFYNGVLQVTSSPVTNQSSQYAMSLGGEYNGTSNQFPSSKRQAFAFVAEYLTDGEVSTLSTIVDTFQTTLGRN